jgi:hypothetical protein
LDILAWASLSLIHYPLGTFSSFGLLGEGVEGTAILLAWKIYDPVKFLIVAPTAVRCLTGTDTSTTTGAGSCHAEISNMLPKSLSR